MQLSNKALLQFFLCIASLTNSNTNAFTLTNPIKNTNAFNIRTGTLQVSASNDIDIESLGLTPQLETMTKAFGSIPDEKLRYKQLLYMANQLKPLDPALAIPENKVPGCLSTVFVDCTPETKVNEETGQEETVLNFVGDSDGLLTKGLVALLVRGLSGCTAEQIQKVNPEFISAAKITQSLTPGRNNGFLNMLAVMKNKAAQYSEGVSAEKPSEKREENEETATFISTFEEVEGKPMYNEMMESLLKLKPSKLELIDESHQHAGHAGSKGWEESGESHFNLTMVADVFEGLSLVKRHQLIYLVLGDTMQKIHALQINAKAPSQV
jgi:sulfur transfer protein SufE/stress-induced morphogen